MEQSSRNPGLREEMQAHSMLSEHDPAELGAYELISEALGDILRPGEQVLAYADRDLSGNQVDVMAYDHPEASAPPDVMGYEPGGPLNETDAFAYDEESGRAQPDVMGYQAGGPLNETDAFAYDRPPETPDNDAFMSPRRTKAADVDFLVLTDSRLIRGFLEDQKVMLTESPYDEPKVQVITETYVAVRLPPAVCGISESDWWCWRAPDGVDARAVARKWTRS
jgi:hypothetical protein